MSSFVKSEEVAFNNKLKELGLRAHYTQEMKEDYGVTFHRLNIKIYRGDYLLCRTSSGFKTKQTFRDNGFMEGSRRLLAIEMNGEHKA